MHTNSLPKSDRDDQELGTNTWTGDADLREKLIEYRDRPGWSNNVLAKRIGCNSAVISLYCHKDGIKPHGDMDKFEKSAWDFIRNEERRRASGVETADCEVAEELRTMLERTRRNNALSEILAESGQGKSRAVELYVKANPTTILYTTRVWSRDVNSIEGAMFEAVGRAGYDNHTKRAEFMVKKLLGSNRLIIVDNGEYLTAPAIHWLYDFHEATQCPLAFIGTFGLAEKLEKDERRASRTWLRFELRPENPRKLIQHLIEQLAPDANGDAEILFNLCEQIADQAGHFRSVHQQLKLAGELRGSNKKLSWPDAVKCAHPFLIRSYKLN